MAKVLVCAEVGVNWNSNLLMAKEMIWQAKDAGANLAKFQFYSAKALFGPDGADPNPSIYEQMTWMDDITFDDAKSLANECRRAEIEFMASSFDEERLGWLEKIGVRRHKLASRSVKYTPDYCEKVLALGKETFVSLGMWHKERWPFPGATNAKFLSCVSKYPTPLAELNIPTRFASWWSIDQSIGDPSKGYPWFYGFSDHSEGIAAALVAVARGAKYIEKHVTLDKNLPGPDQKASITFQELKELVRITREIEQIPGITS